MPDDFQPKPEWNYLDHSPRGEAVPVSGIFDAPAHIAIVNQEWVAFVLGAIDRLGYGDVWAGSDANREHAHHQILELEAMLMSPANYLIPSDTFSVGINKADLVAGSNVGTIVTAPAGKRYLIQTVSIMFVGSINEVRFYTFGIPTRIDYLMLTRNTVPYNTYHIEPNYWLDGATQLRWQVLNSAANDSVWVHASGLIFDQVE